MGWVIVRKSSDQCQMQPLSEALCKIYKEYFRDFVRNSRIFSVQFYGITSRYPCLKKWCVCLHFLPHSKKIKVYQNWFTLKYCHQVTTDVVNGIFSKWRKQQNNTDVVKLPIRIESVTPILVEVDWDKSLLPKLVNPID